MDNYNVVLLGLAVIVFTVFVSNIHQYYHTEPMSELLIFVCLITPLLLLGFVVLYGKDKIKR